MRRSAEISLCLKYRFALGRAWADESSDKPHVVWLMLNPSTADASVDDPTIRKCIVFSKRWGAGSLSVVNLYAFRATKPADLWKADDPVGRRNNDIIAEVCRGGAYPGHLIMAAWGNHGKPDRVKAVMGLLRRKAHRVHCLGTNKNGSPKHPLYVKGDTQPAPWSP